LQSRLNIKLIEKIICQCDNKFYFDALVLIRNRCNCWINSFIYIYICCIC